MKIARRYVIQTLIAVAVINLAGCAVYPAGPPVAYGAGYPQAAYGGSVPGNYTPAPYPAPYPVQPYYAEPYYAPVFPFFGFFGYHHGEERHHRDGRR